MKLSDCSKIFKALSNSQRLKIFQLINKECCPVEGSVKKAFTKACGCMNLSRSTISHHFKQLHKAGLINCEKEGRTFRCSVNKETIKLIRGFLK